ncbi:MAG: hypothetical protein JO313_07660 [Verrucomicrobia bacterium]|nr:hypothetical protein [Verrucomicrobiota bacterium]
MKSFRLLILVSALLVLVFFSGWFALYSFIRSDSFREWLSKKVSHTLRVDGFFEPLNWEGSTFRSAGFTATGTPKSKLRSIHITNISAHFDWRQLLKGTWAVDHVSAEEIEALVGKNPAETPAPANGPTTQPSALKLPDFLPSAFRIEQLYVGSANLHWETNHGDLGQFVGTKVTATRRGPDEWDVAAVGGNARHSAYPPLQIDYIHAALSENSIAIREAKALVPGGGEIQLAGKVFTGRQLNAEFAADFSNLDANQALPPEWHIGGKSSGHLVYAGDLDRFEHGQVTGSIKIAGAAIDMTNLFVTLHELAKFGGLKDVRIDSIETHLKYHEHELELSDFRASYQDQIRVEGAGVIRPNRLDGSLLIGLSPKILGWIPGAQERVFIDERDGLRWAKVNISGTPDQPKEDLTRRLISAFRDKMTQEFRGQAKDAVKSLLDMFHQ